MNKDLVEKMDALLKDMGRLPWLDYSVLSRNQKNDYDMLYDTLRKFVVRIQPEDRPITEKIPVYMKKEGVSNISVYAWDATAEGGWYDLNAMLRAENLTRRDVMIVEVVV